MIRATIIALTLKYCAIYGVAPEFALAVCNVESRDKHQEFRVGKVGKLWLPHAIHDDFRKLRGWEVNDLEENVRIGVMALRGDCKRKILRRYNRSYNQAYQAAVDKAEAMYKRELYCK